MIWNPSQDLNNFCMICYNLKLLSGMVVSHKIHKSTRTLFWTAFGIFEDFTDHNIAVY